MSEIHWKPSKITDDELTELEQFNAKHPKVEEALWDIAMSGSDIACELVEKDPSLQLMPSGDGSYIVGVVLDEHRFVSYHLVPTCVYRKQENP